MTHMKWMIALAAAGWLTLASLPAAHGGYYWEMTEVQERMGIPEGMPANLPQAVKDQFSRTTERTVRHYAGDDGYRTEDGEMIVIMDYRTMTVFSIDPGEKTYFRVDIQNLGQDQPVVGEMARAMKQSITITPSDEVRKIAGYTCRKYTVSSMMGSGEYWASKEVKAYPYLKSSAEKMGRAMAANPMFARMNLGDLIARIEGFPVRTVMNVMGATTTVTLKHIESRDLDKALFQIPAGYAEEAMPAFE